MTMATDTQSAKYLQGMIDNLRNGGHEPPDHLVRQLEAAKEREANFAKLQADAKQRREAEAEARLVKDAEAQTALEARREESAKAEARAAWLAAGGKAEEFDAAWPTLHKKIVEARALAAMTTGSKPRLLTGF